MFHSHSTALRVLLQISIANSNGNVFTIFDNSQFKDSKYYNYFVFPIRKKKSGLNNQTIDEKFLKQYKR